MGTKIGIYIFTFVEIYRDIYKMIHEYKIIHVNR